MKQISQLSFLILIVVSACAKSADPNSPPDIKYGYDTCRECGMSITGPPFCAALYDQNSNVLRFDDIGCMLTYLNKNSEPPKAIWVMDYYSHKWIRAEKAIYIYSKKGLETPMGYGIAATSNLEKAHKLAETSHGAIISWQEIQAKISNPSKNPDQERKK